MNEAIRGSPVPAHSDLRAEASGAHATVAVSFPQRRLGLMTASSLPVGQFYSSPAYI